jgi:stalled ribosome alternative rescue factor ArfA
MRKRKASKQTPRRRSTVARAVRTPRFRPKVESAGKGKGAYRRRRKHPKAPESDESS